MQVGYVVLVRRRVSNVVMQERKGSNNMAYRTKNIITTKEMAKMHRACGYTRVRVRRSDSGVKRGKRR
jgi:hypothetical protein